MNSKRYKYIKKILVVFISLIIATSNICKCFADIDNEEDIEIENLENVSAEVYKQPQIASKYAICIEKTTNTILYENKAYEKTPMASTTKIMTAILAIEKGDLKAIVTISKKAAQTSGSRFELEENMQVSLNDLLYGLMLRSRK